MHCVRVSRLTDLHKWDAGGPPSQVIELQEMGVDGQGSREPGGSNQDTIFFMKYPLSFLKYWYTTFPLVLQETKTTGTSVVSCSSVSVGPGMSGENSSGDTQSKIPHLTPRKANLLYKCNVCEYHVLHKWVTVGPK